MIGYNCQLCDFSFSSIEILQDHYLEHCSMPELQLYPHQIKKLYELGYYFPSSGLMSELFCPKPYVTHIVSEEVEAKINSILEPDYDI